MMRSLWQTIYSLLVLPPLWVALHIAALLREKVRRGIRGRRGLFQDLERHLRSVGAGPRVWFHSSSMGEFEQARPIIAMLKKRRPEVRIIVTFFSPSGYEHTKNYPLADLISYLPFDTRNNAARFLDLVRPDAAVMVRYDIWPHHIWELRRRTIPIMIANATMRRQTARRIPLIRSFHRSVYGSMTHILTASEADADTFTLFRLDGPTIEAIGDTRFDQVTTRSAQARERTLIPPELLRKKKVFVVGSSWPEDDAVVLPSFLNLAAELPELLMILVPHEPTPRHLEELEDQLAGKTTVLRFSALEAYAGQRVLLVDSVGILMSLYASAHVAYVGGSFRQGVHNVLEAAVYGIPVLFGPRHWNAREPLQLLDYGGAFVVENSAELSRTLGNLLADEQARHFAGWRAEEYVRARTGATARVVERLESCLNMPPRRR
jgi:3-deoxy-D-manno-octulosonic-acid transferase